MTEYLVNSLGISQSLLELVYIWISRNWHQLRIRSNNSIVVSFELQLEATQTHLSGEKTFSLLSLFYRQGSFFSLTNNNIMIKMYPVIGR